MFDIFEKRYADMTFANGTMVDPARATIDHGRLLTLQRREKFRRVEVRAVSRSGRTVFRLSGDELLSPRRINRKLKLSGVFPPEPGRVSADIADVVFLMLRSWQDYGFSPSTPITGEVRGGWVLKLAYKGN